MHFAEVKFIYLDLGWTLVDETKAHLRRARNLAEFLAPRGVGLGFLPSFQSALGDLGVNPESVGELVRAVPYSHDGEELYAGVPELLQELHRRYRLGIIANQAAGTEARLERWGIRRFFEVVLASAEMGIAKPDPRLFAEAERRAGVPASAMALVGDRLDNDIRPAKQRGWKTVRVLQGWCRKQTPLDALELPELAIWRITDLEECLSSTARGKAES